VTDGRVEGPDLTFTQDRATAGAIARGELSAQAAFLDGRLRVGGDLSAARSRARALAAIADVFASPRAVTTW
jgi:putative sterol carrier protein